MSKQDKYTKSARDQFCTVRTDVCNHNPETVVLAHLGGAGMGMKHSNIHGAYACSACHAWLDGLWCRTPAATSTDRDLMHLKAVIRTQQIMIKDGVLKL